MVSRIIGRDWWEKSFPLKDWLAGLWQHGGGTAVVREIGRFNENVEFSYCFRSCWSSRAESLAFALSNKLTRFCMRERCSCLQSVSHRRLSGVLSSCFPQFLLFPQFRWPKSRQWKGQPLEDNRIKGNRKRTTCWESIDYCCRPWIVRIQRRSLSIRLPSKPVKCTDSWITPWNS